jgi:hypothetical protein
MVPAGVAAWAVCGTTAAGQYLDEPRPRCAVDMAEPFGVVNFFDVAAYLRAFSVANPAADAAAPWGELNFFDVSAFLARFVVGCDADADADGIPDWAETDDGVFRGPFATGTSPFNADTDGDGLSDGDEIFGTAGGLDLPALGADPLIKDIFIECDWFAGEFEGATRDFRPRPQAVARVEQAFANAPVPNPYGAADGIRIHLDYGQGGVFTGGERLPGQPVFISFPDEFLLYRSVHFDARREGFFHYAVFANRYNSADNRSSGVAFINGSGFMVTMLDYLSSFNQSQTIVHELGHNLGLRHGGFENRNHKPNYNSVMNYRHQFTGVDTTGDTLGNGVLDYSRHANADIDESAVDEQFGVIGIPVDFNRDGVFQAAPYTANLNCWGGAQPCGSGTDCSDAVCTVLRDHDDWGSINWGRLTTGRSEQEAVECTNEPGRPQAD